MKEQYHKWFSPSLGKDIEMLVFGDRGYPVILFPTSMGSFSENKDFGLLESASWFINEGLIKVYCPDSIDKESWYNKSVHPATKVYNHICYDNMLNNELVPRAMYETGVNKIVAAGCSFGGYHAANYAFKHPENTGYMFSMSGAFNIKSFMNGFYSDEVYFNNPTDFIPNANHQDIWNMGIVLGTSEWDICRKDNEEMAEILNKKSIPHWLDIRPQAKHDWPVWREMFPHYLSRIQ